MKNFVLIGISGYVAKKHLFAIKNSNNNLIAAYDVNKNLDNLKKYFPNCNFFTKLKDLRQHIKNSKKKIHYLTVCSPNYLHFRHIKFGIMNNLDVICEKPIVLKKYQLEVLKSLSKKKNKKIFSILQLRHHPSLLKLKKNIIYKKKISKVNLIYYTERDEKYFKTWKGNDRKSGGILLNIGVHFFDLLLWIFGDIIDFKISILNSYRAKGTLQLKKANVKWDLSVKSIKLNKKKKLKVFRSIKVDGNEVKFSKTFDDLHLLNYKFILKNRKNNLQESFKPIKLINDLKNLHNAI